VGSFADPGFAAPTYSHWEESMHGWIALPTVPEQFAQGRPDSEQDTGERSQA